MLLVSYILVLTIVGKLSPTQNSILFQPQYFIENLFVHLKERMLMIHMDHMAPNKRFQWPAQWTHAQKKLCAPLKSNCSPTPTTLPRIWSALMLASSFPCHARQAPSSMFSTATVSHWATTHPCVQRACAWTMLTVIWMKWESQCACVALDSLVRDVKLI